MGYALQPAPPPCGRFRTGFRAARNAGGPAATGLRPRNVAARNTVMPFGKASDSRRVSDTCRSQTPVRWRAAGMRFGRCLTPAGCLTPVGVRHWFVGERGDAGHLLPRRWQRDVFGFIARHDLVEAAAFPVELGLLDAVFAAGHEVPPDEARPVQGLAAQYCKSRRFPCLDFDRFPGRENQQLPRLMALAVDFDHAAAQVCRALFMFGGHDHGGARLQHDISEEQRRQGAYCGSLAEYRTGHHARLYALAFYQRLRVEAVMHEARIGFFVPAG